jgi:hypothetical protein
MSYIVILMSFQTIYSVNYDFVNPEVEMFPVTMREYVTANSHKLSSFAVCLCFKPDYSFIYCTRMST